MDGILIVNKDKGMTSHDVVFRLRKILNTKKIGHSGTLDPNATGVLVVLIGKACKILPFIEDVDKEYVATLELGRKTISDDIWGETLETKPITHINNFDDVLQSFRGKILQRPPLISSIKINGKKLYEYARNNESVEIPKREVEIYDIETLDVDKLAFRVHCSSGTYIRSLCFDIAEKTGNLGCMSSLIRTKVGRFSLTDAYTLDEIQEGNYKLYSIKEMLSHFSMVVYEPVRDIYHGKKIHLDVDSDQVVMLDGDDVIAIYKRHHNDVFACVRGLW